MRSVCLVLLWVFIGPAWAQQPRAVDNRSRHACESIVAAQAWNPYAYIGREQCYDAVLSYRQEIARIYGKPQPSKRVVDVPAHGTPEAKKYGIACVGGLVMVRLKNGWEQALDPDRPLLHLPQLLAPGTFVFT